MSKPIIVFGGTGNTGHRVVLGLLRGGHAVRVITRRPQSDIARLLESKGAELHTGDLQEPWTTWNAVEGCGTVVSCVHIKHAAAVVAAARAGGATRLVAFSSTRRYSRVPCPTVRQVLRGERAIERSGLDWTIIRPTMIYDGRNDKNVTRLMAWLRRTRVYPVPMNGGPLVQPVHSDDVADFAVRIVHETAAVGRAYDLSGRRPITYREMVEGIGRSIERPPVFVPYPGMLVPLAAAVLGNRLRKFGVDRATILRLREDKAISHRAARKDFGYAPREFLDA